MRALGILLIVLALIIGCSVNPSDTAGGTTDTGNAVIAGIMVDSMDNPVEGTIVSLIPEDYNPVLNSSDEIVTDTTDSEGRYSFIMEDSLPATFNIGAVHLQGGTRTLITGIQYFGDTVSVEKGVLELTGAIQIIVSDSINKKQGYVFIPGTDIFKKLSPDQIFEINGVEFFVFDRLPSNIKLNIFYMEKDSSFTPFTIEEQLTIVPGDTITITFIESWDGYNTSNSGLPENNLQALLAASDGTLWIGTKSNGLVRFDGKIWTNFTSRDSTLPNDTVFALAEDHKGHIWVGTAGGVVHTTDTGWVVFTEANSSMADEHISDIAIDTLGRAWFSSNNGVLSFTDSSWIHYTMAGGIPLTEVFTAEFNNAGALSIGTTEGLFQYTTTWVFIPVLGEATNTRVEDIAFDKSGAHWLATPKGIIRYYDGQWNTYNTINSGLPTNSFKSVMVDNNDDVWAGAHSNGVIVKIGDGTTVYSGSDVPELSGAGAVNETVVDAENVTYFATENNGLVYMKFIIAQ